MYQPPHFREDRLDRLHDFIAARGFGLLISSSAEGPVADALPFLIDRAAGDKGVLRAHLARANPQVGILRAGGPVLVVFSGADFYVTPSWYPTKQETGRVVPTWNYTLVQVHGRARLIEDADWLARQIADLTANHERARPDPWAVDDAPADFIAMQMKGVVGLEIAIERIDGKVKMSQNRTPAERAGVAAGLRAEGRSDRAREGEG